LAGPTVPPTGHSTKAAPFFLTLAARAFSVSGRTVLMSMKSFPATLRERRPSWPRYAASIAAASVRIVMITSEFSATFAGVATALAPAAASTPVFSACGSMR
jgi:hypothetical protein